MRELASIQKISEVLTHSNADNLDIVKIKGWQVITKKGEFKKNDLCVYCEIDSLLPEEPQFEFLRNNKFRIKTIKLRGEISQGIALPLSVLNNNINIAKGIDVTDILNVKKYEQPIPACLSGKVKGSFPSHSEKTDEERIQNLYNNYDYLKQFNYYVTEKIDGSSASFIIYEDKFSVCSRNLELIEDDTNSFWKVARQLDIESKMRQYMNKHNINSLTLQGELIGEGIQKNIYKINGQTVYFFRAFNPQTFTYYEYDSFINMIHEMSLQTVPILETNFQLPSTINELLLYANNISKLYKTNREGIVLIANNVSHGTNRLSFKVISNKFLLKHD